jgi:hypothetical protein
MNNSNDLTKTILQTIENNNGGQLESGSNSIFSTDNLSNSGSAFIDYIKSITWTTWILIILILSFLGFNIFVYLAKGTQGITDFFKTIFGPILSFFGIATVDLIDNTAEGGKIAVNKTANIIDRGLTGVQDLLPDETSGSSGASLKNSIPQPDVMKNNALNQALNKSNIKQSNDLEYQADESTSSIQKPPSKAGYCYIGEEKGYRTCMYVNESDTCMSGNIFPTNEICVNPTLRT